MIVKRKWAAFLLAVIPGLGHLYLGLNRQGLKFMIGAFLSITLIPMMPMVFPFVLAIIWFYSLFDALQKATLINLIVSQRNNGGYEMGGSAGLETLGSIADMQSIRQDDVIEPFWLGGGCILAGILLFIHSLFPKLWSLLLDRHVGSILTAVLLIAVGLWILYKNNSHKSMQE